MVQEEDSFKKRKFSATESLNKIYRYCSYQERSHQEVKNKLYSYGITTDEVNEILSKLVIDGFLNEARFAKAFAGGKFRIKKWGRNKIISALESKGLTLNCIRGGLKEIDDQGYRKTLSEVIRRKALATVDKSTFQKRSKVATYAISRGYEPDLVWDLVRSLIPA